MHLPTRQIRVGVLAGAAILVLLVGLIVVGTGGLFVYNRISKPDETQTSQTQVSSSEGETFSQEGTQAASPISERTQPANNSATQFPEIISTSTLFSPAEKPDDVPLMPGAMELAVVQLNQEQANPVIQLLFQTDVPEDEIIAFYEREMLINGWTKTSTYMDGNQRVITFTKGDRMAIVQITQTSTPRMVAIMIMEQ